MYVSGSFGVFAPSCVVGGHGGGAMNWDWLPWRAAAQNRVTLDELQRYGLSALDRYDFELACRIGVPTPPWVQERLTAAAKAWAEDVEGRS